MFNLRHAQARNCIERIFGISKKPFAILKSLNEYPYDSQVKLVLALAALHDFIFKCNREDECLIWEQEEEEERWRIERGNRNRRRAQISNEFDIDPAADDIGMKAFQDKMVEQMWIDYQAYITR